MLFSTIGFLATLLLGVLSVSPSPAEAADRVERRSERATYEGPTSEGGTVQIFLSRAGDAVDVVLTFPGHVPEGCPTSVHFANLKIAAIAPFGQPAAPRSFGFLGRRSDVTEGLLVGHFGATSAAGAYSESSPSLPHCPSRQVSWGAYSVAPTHPLSPNATPYGGATISLEAGFDRSERAPDHADGTVILELSGETATAQIDVSRGRCRYVVSLPELILLDSGSIIVSSEDYLSYAFGAADRTRSGGHVFRGGFFVAAESVACPSIAGQWQAIAQ